MTDIIVIAIFATGVCIGFFSGLLRGYEIGCKDTERRWSAAVTRADADRARS